MHDYTSNKPNQIQHRSVLFLGQTGSEDFKGAPVRFAARKPVYRSHPQRSHSSFRPSSGAHLSAGFREPLLLRGIGILVGPSLVFGPSPNIGSQTAFMPHSVRSSRICLLQFLLFLIFLIVSTLQIHLLTLLQPLIAPLERGPAA
jgi:hypothetical protein